MFGQLAPLKRDAMRWLPSLKILCAFAVSPALRAAWILAANIEQA